MQNHSSLQRFSLIHCSLAKILQELLRPIQVLELGEIMCQLHDVILANFEVDEYVLTIDLIYSVKKSNMLTFIGSEVCHSNQFGLVIANEYIDNHHGVLSLSFLHHKLEFFIDAFNNNEKEDIPESLMDMLDHLGFNIPEKNMKLRSKDDAQKLISWAKVSRIGENTLPYSHSSNFWSSLGVMKEVYFLQHLTESFFQRHHLFPT